MYLALDTATDTASVAVGTPQRLAAEVLVTERRHAATLAPAIDFLLKVADVSVERLVGLIVADGPGSFTGLRIGLATAKGLIRAHEHLRLVVVSSLLGAAWSARTLVDGAIASLSDAMRGELFGAVYRCASDRVETLLSPTLGTPEAIAHRSPVTPALAVGDGALQHAEWVRQWTDRAPWGPPTGAARAAALLELLAVPGASQLVTDVNAFEPTYGRLAEAQVRWEREHGRPLPG